ncbi:6-phosphogluconate dehydrogenase-like protein [Polyplosphaeria fusca]|uniref:6-phosphogluconate dehydrogenase-like protein n=1 Tax=Polyplosphaeria fusca TaxID=682080 RepID=A0A9P4QL92_9PLEO|nr:6-phosphogluconate dehydrogenase-like protein [Polyplosphaeria fusca]
MAAQALRFAFLGIGPMGEGMSENLIAKGNLQTPLILWNRTKERAIELSKRVGNSIVADSLKDTVPRADVLWMCFQDEAAVVEIMDELLTTNVAGKLFVDSSTISPSATNELASRVINAGAEFVAVPVFGDPSMAKIGALTLIPAGNPESVSRILPYLGGVVGRAVVDLSGEKPGQASLLKFIGNVLIMTSIEVAAEMNVFAEKTDLGAHNILKLFEALMPGSPHVVHTKQMISGDYHKHKPGVPVAHAIGLTSKVQELAHSKGVSLKAYEVAVNHLKDVEAHVGSSGGIFSIYGVVRKEGGLPFEN